MEISSLLIALIITALVVMIGYHVYQIVRAELVRKSIAKKIMEGIKDGSVKVHKIETFENDNMVIPDWIKAMPLEEIERVKEACERRIHGEN